MSDHEQTLRELAAEEQSKLDSLPTAKGKGEPTSEAADRFRARRAACLSGADALVRATQTCATCRWVRYVPSNATIEDAEALCGHESEAHPLHWCRPVGNEKTFGCTYHEPAGATREAE